AGFEPSVVLESDSPETVRELIRAGIGISFIPSITWQGMDTKNIALVPISFPQCRRYINLSWRSQGYLSPAAILFRDFVQDYFRAFQK
ncbi:LysR family transcriptional regulator substrate-binding protein, partial [Hungatella hathewayi]